MSPTREEVEQAIARWESGYLRLCPGNDKDTIIAWVRSSLTLQARVEELEKAVAASGFEIMSLKQKMWIRDAACDSAEPEILSLRAQLTKALARVEDSEKKIEQLQGVLSLERRTQTVLRAQLTKEHERAEFWEAETGRHGIAWADDRDRANAAEKRVEELQRAGDALREKSSWYTVALTPKEIYEYGMALDAAIAAWNKARTQTPAVEDECEQCDGTGWQDATSNVYNEGASDKEECGACGGTGKEPERDERTWDAMKDDNS